MRESGRIGPSGAAAAMLVAAVAGCHAALPAETGRPSSQTSPLEGRTQVVTVVTEGWDSFRATLRRFERNADEWREVGAPVEAVIGREGYGWGRGLHGDGAPPTRPGPAKVEGDGKSPAGVFAIGAAYGYANNEPGVLLPYSEATATLRCVDDPESAHYNSIVSSDEVEVDWRSAEYMRREDDLYVLTIVVEHNTRRPRPGGGSCIFLHLWNGPDVGMSGCTAMSMDALEELAAWLRPGEAVVVGLPDGEYAAMSEAWGLPPQKSH